MAKKKARPTKRQTKKKPAAQSIDVAALRSEIDGLDRDLVKALNQRARAARKLGGRKLGGRKRPAGESPAVIARDEDTLGRVAKLNRGPLSERCVRAVFRELLSGCRSLGGELTVAFLGPQYSYSHLAAILRFGHAVGFTPVGSIAAVFEEVNRGHSDFGLVPIENSTDGRVADTLDMFTRLPVRICGEVQLEIHHALLGRCSRDDVKEVYSRPQALSQCRNWLAKHLPAARSVEVTSTSTAAQLAMEKPGAAAIASLEAGVHYGLNVLVERIEDNPNNTTRFAIIGDKPAEPTGDDRVAIMFQTEHRSGALVDALGVFKRNRLNMTWIESFPIPGTERAYVFFVELEGHETDAAVLRATTALERSTLRMEILGSFPTATLTD